MGKNNYTKEAEHIGKLIVRSVENNLKLEYTVDYRGYAISIRNVVPNEDVYIWIRLNWRQDKCICNILTASFAPELQRKGYFTKIINTLKRCKYIQNICIQSVCSNEMHNWCKKHKFKQVVHPLVTVSDYHWKDI